MLASQQLIQLSEEQLRIAMRAYWRSKKKTSRNKPMESFIANNPPSFENCVETNVVEMPVQVTR
jgi:hypothetical protein